MQERSIAPSHISVDLRPTLVYLGENMKTFWGVVGSFLVVNFRFGMCVVFLLFLAFIWIVLGALRFGWEVMLVCGEWVCWLVGDCVGSWWVLLFGVLSGCVVFLF